MGVPWGIVASRESDDRDELLTDWTRRARLDALSFGDGTYDMFERLFDGYEIFVPWDTFGKIEAKGCVADGWRSARTSHLASWMRDDIDPDLATLTRELRDAAVVATDLSMVITISF